VTSILRRHLAATLVVTVVTAWHSYGYFHIDEYFQVLELARFKLGHVEAWALPWEHTSRMRPWLQPALYVAIARITGASDPFVVAFLSRLATGLACVAALASFLRTSLVWLRTEDEKRLHVRVATLLGFLPFLYVRTSSETLSMAAFTAGFALALEGTDVSPREDGTAARPVLAASPSRLLDAGILFGLAFEARFQTAFLTAGLLAWMRIVARAPFRKLAVVVAGVAAALALGALVDRWGYGVWTFPAWTYVKANMLEGVALFYGSDPPFSYFVSLPANVFAPIVVVLLVFALASWLRCPRHPVTWTTLPFFLVHNLLAHKEERFLFPMAILAVAFVSLAIAPSAGKPTRLSSWLWRRRRSVPVYVLATFSTLMMLFLAFYPLGWHHHVAFQRYVHESLGGELRAFALPDFDLGLPAFHPRIYDVEKADAATIARRSDERPWLVVDTPLLSHEAPALAHSDCTTLVWSELPIFRDAALTATAMQWVETYNARRVPPLRPLRFRSLYRLAPSCKNTPPAHSQVFFADPGVKLLGAPE
jgi:phosphatidylinositol glycan class B